jgi:hypothetical protein
VGLVPMVVMWAEAARAEAAMVEAAMAEALVARAVVARVGTTVTPAAVVRVEATVVAVMAE